MKRRRTSSSPTSGQSSTHKKQKNNNTLQPDELKSSSHHSDIQELISRVRDFASTLKQNEDSSILKQPGISEISILFSILRKTSKTLSLLDNHYSANGDNYDHNSSGSIPISGDGSVGNDANGGRSTKLMVKVSRLNLPVGIMATIFSFLAIPDLSPCTRVCRLWKNTILNQSIISIQHLHFKSFSIDEIHLWRIFRYLNLIPTFHQRSVSLKKRIQTSVISRVNCNPKSFVYSTRMSLSSVLHISEMYGRSITRFEWKNDAFIRAGQMTLKFMKSFSSLFPNLRHLKIYHAPLGIVKFLPKLESLNISNIEIQIINTGDPNDPDMIPTIPKKCLEWFGKHKSLKKLKITGVDMGLLALLLHVFPNLETLVLNEFNDMENDLEDISKLHDCIDIKNVSVSEIPLKYLKIHGLMGYDDESENNFLHDFLLRINPLGIQTLKLAIECDDDVSPLADVICNFINLKYLNVELGSIPCKFIEKFFSQYKQLEKLDFSVEKYSSLSKLALVKDTLSSLVVSSSEKIYEVQEAQKVARDIEKLTKLTYLAISANIVAQIDFTKLPNLNELEATYDVVPILKIENCKSLVSFEATDASINHIMIKNCPKLEAISPSTNTNSLEIIDCPRFMKLEPHEVNNLVEIHIENTKSPNQFPMLSELSLISSTLSHFDVNLLTLFPNLKELTCSLNLLQMFQTTNMKCNNSVQVLILINSTIICNDNKFVQCVDLFPNLRKLYLHGCKFCEDQWDSKYISKNFSLKELDIKETMYETNVNAMKFLFTIFPNIQHLAMTVREKMILADIADHIGMLKQLKGFYGAIVTDGLQVDVFIKLLKNISKESIRKFDVRLDISPEYDIDNSSDCVIRNNILSFPHFPQIEYASMNLKNLSYDMKPAETLREFHLYPIHIDEESLTEDHKKIIVHYLSKSKYLQILNIVIETTTDEIRAIVKSLYELQVYPRLVSYICGGSFTENQINILEQYQILKKEFTRTDFIINSSDELEH